MFDLERPKWTYYSDDIDIAMGEIDGDMYLFPSDLVPYWENMRQLTPFDWFLYHVSHIPCELLTMTEGYENWCEDDYDENGDDLYEIELKRLKALEKYVSSLE